MWCTTTRVSDYRAGHAGADDEDVDLVMLCPLMAQPATADHTSKGELNFEIGEVQNGPHGT